MPCHAGGQPSAAGCRDSCLPLQGAKDFMGGMGLGMVAEQLTDLKLSELLDTPPPGLDEAVAIAKVSCSTNCVCEVQGLQCTLLVGNIAAQTTPGDWTRLSPLSKSGEAVCILHTSCATWPSSAAGECQHSGQPPRLSLLPRADGVMETLAALQRNWSMLEPA